MYLFNISTFSLWRLYHPKKVPARKRKISYWRRSIHPGNFTKERPFTASNLYLDFRLTYDRSKLTVSLAKGDSPLKIEGEIPFSLAEQGLFDSTGKAFVGVINDGFNASYRTDVKSFALRGLNTFNAEDPWRDLSVRYTCRFPVDLVLSPVVLEQFKNIFRLLFPIKRTEYHLHACWKTISVITKNKEPESPEERSRSAATLAAALRAQMAAFVQGLLGYFYADVLEVRWGRLRDSLASLTEFDELRAIVSNYLESIYIHTFLNLPKIIANIFELVAKINKFVVLVERIGQQTADEGIWNEDEFREQIREIHDDFDYKIKEFISQIKTLNQISSSQYLSQLLTRLNFNEYYSGLYGIGMDIEQ